MRLNDNLSLYLVNRGSTGVASGRNWEPVSTTGTGSTQAIQIPESGLSIGDVLVFQDGVMRSSGYHISDKYLVLEAPAGSEIKIVRYGVGARGEKGDRGDPGQPGLQGPAGEPYIIMGTLPSVIDLPREGPANRGWVVESHLWTWINGSWVDLGDILTTTAGGYDYDMDGGNF